VKQTYSICGSVLLFFMYAIAAAGQPDITGHTLADTQLSGDIKDLLLVFAKGKLKCSTIDSILAEDVPADFVAPPVRGPTRDGPTRYERWTAVGCQNSAVFLVEWWKAADGGSQFGVSPFPHPTNAS
jgi:hypothetical protein